MESYSSTLLALFVPGIPLFLVAGSYIFFIVASIAVARSRTARLEELADLGALGARGALEILERSENYLLCAQVGRFLSSVGAGLLLASLMRQLPLTLVELGVSGLLAYEPVLSGLLFASFVGITLVLVQIAKAVSLQFPERCLCSIALPFRAAYKVFGPVVVCVHSAVSRVLTSWNLRRSTERDLAVSTDDLSELVRRSSEAGQIEQNEKELIEGIVELSERIVREVMTPRKDVVFVRESASTAELVETFVQEGVSRVLVCGADLDEVKGVVLGKDLMRYVGKSVSGVAWREYVRPAYFIPNTKPVDDLLFELRQKGSHLAVVLNEHGGVDGVVTLEDLVEEIVGDISDEFDQPCEQALILRDESGALTMDASVKISRLEDEFDVTLPEGEYDTVAGFVLAHLGHLPIAGERVVGGDIEILVQSVDNNRIGRVIIRPIPQEPLAVAAPEPLTATSSGEVSSGPIVATRISQVS